MKKFAISFPLASIASALLLGLLVNHAGNKASVTVAETQTPVILTVNQSSLPEGTKTFIPMEAESFNNYSENLGTFADENATFWDDGYTFSQRGVFFRGETNEGNTAVDLQVKPWTQYTQYVHFTWGGANNNRGGDPGEVKLIFAINGKNIETGEDINSTQDVWNDTFIGNTMLYRYYKIPDDIYSKLDTEAGFEMSVRLFDSAPNNYGFHNFGNFYVNQTLEDVRTAAREGYAFVKNDTRKYENKNGLLVNYALNGALRDVMYAQTLESVSQDFESMANFYETFYYDADFATNIDAELHFEQVIGTGNYRPADQNMPFNKEGNGFFRGWYEGAAEYDGQHAGQGFVASDGPKYRFVSNPYKLNDTNHYVSIKMAGTASLQVLTENKEMLAEIKCQSFKTEGSQWQHEDGHMNSATMRRHIINLSAFKGQTVRFAICDYRTWGWGAAYFDDFNCNYDPASGINADIIEQYSGFHWDEEQGRNVISEIFYTVQYDIYVPSTNNGRGDAIPNDEVFAGINYADDAAYSVENTTDTSAMVKASAFVMKYASQLKGGKGNDICGSLVSDAAKGLINEFNNLSEEEQVIVAASDDYTVEPVEGKEWFKIAPTFEEGQLGLNLAYLAEVNNTAIDYVVTAISFNLFYTKTNSTYLITLLVIASAVAICLTMVLINKKRKQRR